MVIGVDACCWSNNRGFGRFTRELLSSVLDIDKTNEYRFFVDNFTASNYEFPKCVNVVLAKTSKAPTTAASASGHRSFRDLWALSSKVFRHKLDIFFFPAVYSYFPILNRTRVIVTIHDIIADLYPKLVFPNLKSKILWKLKQNIAIRNSNTVLTVSEFSKQRIMEHFSISESLIRVIPEAPSNAFSVLPKNDKMINILNRYNLNNFERFLLYVGGISPHKNLKSLIQVYRELLNHKMFSDTKLIIVGDYKGDPFYSDYNSLKSLIQILNLNQYVIFTGYVEDIELAYLYNAASLLVIPSYEEGFGLPAVEAMACGTPVVSSNRGSLPEILGDAGRFFDPYDTNTMYRILQDVILNDNMRNEMKIRGLNQAKKFTWERAATKLVSIFSE